MEKIEITRELSPDLVECDEKEMETSVHVAHKYMSMCNKLVSTNDMDVIRMTVVRNAEIGHVFIQSNNR